MSWSRFLALQALLLASVLHPQSADAQAAEGMVRVRAVSDDGPVSEATIRSGDVGGLTNDLGEAVLRLPVGTQVITVEKLGFADEVVSVEVASDTETMVGVVMTEQAEEIERGAPPEVRERYGEIIDAVRRQSEKNRTDGVPPQAYDRVVRIVAWSFLLAVSVMVAVTGLWPETQTTIFALVALAGLFVLVVHDLLPSDALGPAKYVLEGSVAVTFAASSRARISRKNAVSGGVCSPLTR